jgi:predicted Fe-Mo cluster-binding NifX family protein
MEVLEMKIAAITEDGSTISQHFGRAPQYLVVTVENGSIVARELRDKLGHGQFYGSEPEPDHGQGHERHGFGPVADDRHARMSAAIADCEVLLCRGMGMGAYENMKQRNIRPIVTDIENIDEAVMACINGQIVDHVDRLH